jgi:ribosomal-protein-alanine N-acetyltransferase
LLDDPTAEAITLAPLNRAETLNILSWRYPAELATYNFDGTELEAMLDPGNLYFAIRRADQLIGYVCLGAEARVPGLEPSAGVDDLGMGLAPEHVGRGLSRWLIPALIGQLREMGALGGHTVRAVILDWNLRSQRAVRAAGFTPIGTVDSREGRFIVMTRPLP